MTTTQTRAINIRIFMIICGVLSFSASVMAGNVFLTGHDPDFHATIGGHTEGAHKIIRQSLAYARNGSTAPIMFIQSNTDNIALGDHADSELGLISSGFTAGSAPGDNYVKVNATQFATENLDLYSALFVPSDHGGTLTSDELVALNSRSADILDYIYRGGGLVALSEDGMRQPATTGPEPLDYGFLESLVTTSGISQNEFGFTVTPFGESLGITGEDVNGNAAHIVFLNDGGLQVVDFDTEGRIISLAGTLVPEPGSASLAVAGLWILVISSRCRYRTRV